MISFIVNLSCCYSLKEPTFSFISFSFEYIRENVRLVVEYYYKMFFPGMGRVDLDFYSDIFSFFGYCTVYK